MQRLGRNQGRYHGESIPIDGVLAEAHEWATRGAWECDVFLDDPSLTLRAYRRASRQSPVRLYISSGIHGDEPSGPLALSRLLQEDAWPDINLWLIPCLNPSGFRLNTRENARGLDLNRDYRHSRSVEVAAHIAWFEKQPGFDLSLHLHEDWEANGFYVYELNPDGRPSLAEAMVDSVREACPIESADVVDHFECRGGIIRPQVDPEQRPDWPEAIFLFGRKTRQSYTLETPSDYPLAMRVEAHLRALRRALELIGRLS